MRSILCVVYWRIRTSPQFISSLRHGSRKWRGMQASATTGMEIQVAQLKPGSVSRNLWHYRAFPELANHLQPDLIHLTYPVPIDASALRCAVVLTLHDLYP